MSAAALRSTVHREPGRFLAMILALLVHIIFFLFMFFSLNWRSQQPEGMLVDLWHDLPQPAKVTSEITKPLESEPEQQATQKESQSSRISAPQPHKKPEIVHKDIHEDPKPVEKEQLEQGEKEQEEQEQQRKIEAAEKAQAQQREQEEELAKQQEQEALAAHQAEEHARVMDEIAKYKAMILSKIRSRIVMPLDLPGNPSVNFSVVLLPGGDILNVRLHQSSGFKSFDRAVERAIFLSEPLPLPADPALFNAFRDLNITVHYQE